MKSERGALNLWTEPEIAPALWVVGADGGRLALDVERKRELRSRLAAGELDELVFDATVFKAKYPNANYLRFQDEDLEVFATSFVGQPFLRDHDERHIEARGGIIRGAGLAGREFTQRVALTVPRDMEAFLNGQIDRFSISWYWTPPICSVCGHEWLSRDCEHWPGQKYAVGDQGKKQELCELIFVKPRGKETSAVNAPAVDGTGVQGVLAELMAAKEQLWEGQMNEEVEQTPAVSVAGTPSAMVAEAVGPGVDTAEMAALLEAQRVSVLENRLAAAGLPSAFQESVQEMLPQGWKLADLDRLIEVQRGVWAKLEAQRTVQGHDAPRDGRVRGMLDSVDRISEALTALVEGRAPERGVRPLSGLREAYLLLSGDYDMVGMFRPENVSLASVDSSTMSGIVADAMNKVVVGEFKRYPRWWEPIVKIENFTNLQMVRWMTLGGVGDLPTVAEGAAYTELTWNVQVETTPWVKKGGYLGLTLEAMDNDDVSLLRTAPQALAQAAWLSLGKAVAGIFTANSGVGPTMSDGKALFHTDHGNLGTAALDATSWAATRLAMRKQPEANSGARLGALTAPKYVLTPPDQEQAALVVFASEGAATAANPEAEGDTHDARMAAAHRRIIVADLWTDTNNWAAVSDPQMYPAIGLGFRFGREPEIFSVASPTQGLMFTNDVMPIKVRYFFAVGPVDWRGLYKANVSGG